MKDKILNALKSKTFFALAINIVIMALIIGVTAFSYDSADDFYNSLYICQYHNYYNNDINYIFATITGSLQYILLNFNCFVLFQILLSCAAFSSVTFVFVDKFGKHKAFIFTLVLNILFSFDHYSNILSSKTAALLLTAGFLMALNAIRNKRYSLPFWIGVLEVIFGTFLCFKYFFVGLAFFITFFIGDMIAKRKYKATPQGKKELKSATKLRPVILNHAPTKKKKTASILGISKVPPTSQKQPSTTNIYQRK